MSNLDILNPKTILSAFFSIMLGMALLMLLPVFEHNILFMLCFPFIGIFFIVMAIKPEACLVILLFSRALLDPFLELTRVNFMGENIGIGAGLNLVTIFLVILLAVRQFVQGPSFKIFKWWFIFLFIIGLSVTYSPVPGRAIRLYLNFVSYWSMAAIPLLIIKNSKDKQLWILLFALSFILPVITADVDLLRGGHFYADAGMRVRGSFMHPNILAFYLVLGIAAIFYVIKNKSFVLTNTKRNLLKLLLLNMFILLVATKTRNAWIACWGMFLLYGFLRERKYAIGALLILPLTLLVPSVSTRIFDLLQNNPTQGEYHGVNSWVWRVELWKASLPWIFKNPLFGNGLSSFVPLSSNFMEAQDGVGAHNAYWELLFETGLVGLFSYVAIYVSVLKVFFQRLKNSVQNISVGYAIVFAYVFSYVVICVADNLLYYLVLNWYFWFFVGIMLVNVESSKKESLIPTSA